MIAKMTVSDPESDSTNLHSHNGNDYTGSSSSRSNKYKPSTVADAKSSSLTSHASTDSTDNISSGSNSSSNIISQSVAVSSSRREASLPHHVPKIESLSNKMDELRKTMGNEVGGWVEMIIRERSFDDGDDNHVIVVVIVISK